MFLNLIFLKKQMYKIYYKTAFYSANILILNVLFFVNEMAALSFISDKKWIELKMKFILFEFAGWSKNELELLPSKYVLENKKFTS